MPNWCENKLKIKGTTENIIKFLKQVGDEEQIFTFEKIIPEPETEKDCPAEFLIKDAEDAQKHFLAYEENDDRRWFNWHDWHCQKWGCKWDCSVSNSNFSSIKEIKDKQLTEINIWYDTPWGPARGIMEHLIKKEKDYGLKFHFMWFEPNMAFCGELSDDIYYDDEYNCYYDEEEDDEGMDEATQDFTNRFYEEG